MTIRVAAGGQAYDIQIGDGILSQLPARLAELGLGTRAIVVTDSNVADLHGPTLMMALRDAGGRALQHVVAAGEASKSLSTAEVIYGRMAEAAFDRTSVVIALGGGVVGDLAGFVAGTWHRGVGLVQCPTSTEAAFDAAVGGKTALNLRQGKNLIGVFHQPRLVWIDTATFRSLPARDYRAGLAESVKHALISGEDHLKWHEDHGDRLASADPALLPELVARNCRIKAAIVAADERETATGPAPGRALLNFGHTVGHALESHFGYSLRHGECVGLGVCVALRLGIGRGLTEPGLLPRTVQLLGRLGLPVRLPEAVTLEPLMSLMRRDKKASARGLRFVIVERPGVCRWLDEATEADLEQAMQAIA